MFLKIFWHSMCAHWFFAIPCTVAHQAPLPTGFPRQNNWSGLPFPPPGDLSNPEIKPKSLALAGGFFTTEPPGKLLSQFSRVWLSAFAWTAARQASLSITNSRSLLKLMSIALVMPSNHLILCPSLLLPPSIFPSIRVFSNELVLQVASGEGNGKTLQHSCLENPMNNMKREATTCLETLRWKIVSREVWHNKFK